MQPPSNDFRGPDAFDSVLKQALAPGLFFVRRDHQLMFHPPSEETITWEIFRGQLLDSRHTREQQAFLSYHVGIRDSEGTQAPLLTLRISRSTPPSPLPTVHVTRWLRLRIWEAFDDNGAIGSREAERWVEELVGTASLATFNDLDSLLQELRLLVFHAFVGLSRLPLNSVEAPLPAFSLGMVGFFPSIRDADDCVRNPIALLDHAGGSRISLLEESKLLEFFLRTASPLEIREGALEFARRVRDGDEKEAALCRRLRRLFNETSLTPYTGFVEKTLTFARLLFEQDALALENYAGFLLGLIRQTVYHLTAYDLITFHHQGANYPDALLLDALLRDVLALASTYSDLFVVNLQGEPRSVAGTRRRRRALVLGWWMHRFLNGLPVPEEPTSPGENARILPPPHRRVPDEQLLKHGRRTRYLFAENAIDWQNYQGLLQACVEELEDPEMLLELGTALYLDRPFGTLKPPGSLDLTPLLSYALFSRTVAHERLNRFEKFDPHLGSRPAVDAALKHLEVLQTSGLPVPRSTHAGMTLRLQDCWRIADDFVVRRPTPETNRQLRAYFDWENAPSPLNDWCVLGLQPIPVPGPSAPTRIIFFDADWKPQIECEVAAEQGFARQGPLELPMPGLVVVTSGAHAIVASRFPKM
jgi:hypothetical protein